VRIFTPTAEVPFAGHPNVGTAFVLARSNAVFGQGSPRENTQRLLKLAAEATLQRV